jgi:hypothetical protein
VAIKALQPEFSQNPQAIPQPDLGLAGQLSVGSRSGWAGITLIVSQQGRG